MNKKELVVFFVDAYGFVECFSQAQATRGELFRIYLKLDALGRRARRLAELECTEPLPDGAAENSRSRVLKQVTSILAPLGYLDLRVRVHGDPRGPCLEVETDGHTFTF